MKHILHLYCGRTAPEAMLPHCPTRKTWSYAEKLEQVLFLCWCEDGTS